MESPLSTENRTSSQTLPAKTKEFHPSPQGLTVSTLELALPVVQNVDDHGKLSNPASAYSGNGGAKPIDTPSDRKPAPCPEIDRPAVSAANPIFHRVDIHPSNTFKITYNRKFKLAKLASFGFVSSRFRMLSQHKPGSTPNDQHPPPRNSFFANRTQDPHRPQALPETRLQ